MRESRNNVWSKLEGGIVIQYPTEKFLRFLFSYKNIDYIAI